VALRGYAFGASFRPFLSRIFPFGLYCTIIPVRNVDKP
jgi:hypothetical protein